MATETLDDKKPEEEEVIDKENEEGSKEVLEKQMEVEKKKNDEEEEEEEEEEKRGEEEEEESEDEGTKKVKDSSRKGSSRNLSHGTQLKDIPNGIHLFSCLFVFPPKVLLNITWLLIMFNSQNQLMVESISELQKKTKNVMKMIIFSPTRTKNENG
ncbi:protein FANTASTIC FOUR 1-like [Gossypium hirsutum]|uniref:Protein FANTASTIC FOUR 1-like n=1 Tax=Gossypium hirsutum TaxID=3635 RepID=A0A1U8M4R6_GOSHI|nr:protein FANTASTIC FOUR 1-like [Gossypium hirsutum]